MKFSIKISAFIILFGGLTNSLQAQEQKSTTEESTFNKYEAFDPLFMAGQTNAFHSATGEPGPEYWQNGANYNIKATLDTINHAVTGKVTINYTNNSPYKLHFLWLQLDQNTFRKDARGSVLYPDNDRNGVKTFTDGYDLKNVAIKMGKNSQAADYIVTDTRMQIRLPEPLEPKGQEMEISIDYEFKIPEIGKDRMGRVKTKNGWIYTLAQWYPRMVVLDEVNGWNTLPYLGTGEFYLEYGNFDYEITAPANMLVVGSGELQNPKDVLTNYEFDQLEKAKKSDKTVTIRSVEDMLAHKHLKGDSNGMLTWHFSMNQSRDVAWAASKAFIWDAARINLPEGKTALAQSVYPVENSDENGYARSTEYVKNSIELYSKKWMPYTYPVATNVGAHEGGMEYPGIVFCDYKSKNYYLWDVINHEFGHNWFPMIVGSNERKYAWMDEGFNTFINGIDTKEFNNGEYYHESNIQNLTERLFNDDVNPVFTVPDVIRNQQNLAVEAYYKPSNALQILRNVILGEDRFDYAFNTYIKRWAFKHPTPWDFFNTMNSVGGEDLSWFWKGWFMYNWKLDQAVEDIEYVGNDETKGAFITLINNRKMVMPTTLKIVQENGTTETVKLPVEIWMAGPRYVYKYASTSKVVSVEIDPNHELPDINLLNNKMISLMDAPEGTTAKTVIDHYIQAIGGRKILENVKDISQEMSTSISGTPINIIVKKKSPDKYLMYIEAPAMDQTILKYAVNGDDVYVMSRGQKQELNEEQKESIKKGATMFPELLYGTDAYKSKLLGIQYVNNESSYVVEVTTPDGEFIKDFFNVDSGLKIKQQVSADGNTTSTSYSDYRNVNGVMLPFKQITDTFGQNMELNLQEVKINAGIEDSEFE